MPLLKNVAGQKIAVFAYDVAAGAGKTGDQANITAQISKDFGVSAALADTNPVQLDATNHPGWYVFDLAQDETNAGAIIITVSSTTAGIKFAPMVLYPTIYDSTKAGYLDAAVSTRSTLTAQQVWEYATRTLSSFGTLVADAAAAVWGAVTRSLTDKAGFAISGTKQTLDALQDLSQTQAETAAAAALAAYDPPTKAEMDAALTALNDITVADLLAGNLADGQTFAAGSLADRIRKIFWIVCNKMAIIDASGNFTAYKDDGATPAATGTINDNGVITTRGGPTWP